jgi:PleD family two-component response regulator
LGEAKPTLLIVEDDLDLAEMLQGYFRTQDYEVLTAFRGGEAVQSCRYNHPDLVILDIRLPDFDGFEVARRLRGNRRTEDIPIIFLTEKRNRVDKLQGLELGADDYLTKPFDIQELRLRVRNTLRRSARSALNNPVTGLPEGVLVDERLSECLAEESWGILLISLLHLDAFSATYGFVTSDDVLRAVALMIQNAVRELGSPSDFLGQIGPTDFVVVTTPEALLVLSERIRARLDGSLDYFYPLKDREEGKITADRMEIFTTELVGMAGVYPDVDHLKAGLFRNKP